MAIRTRFAPSPTGYLHIGGVRTALFNWLLTRRLGGQFVLRIDDTDAERNRPEALQPILDGFRWLGITWDEGPEVGGSYGPYFQSQRNQLYVDAALKLIDTGHAYPCYTSKEVLDAARKEAEKAKKNYVHRGEHRNTPPAENRKLYDARPTTIRLKVPEGRTAAIEDQIRGRVEWQTDLIGDPVILRPDGRALYNFATVVDDVGLKITHVVRAAEHLTNTAVQVLAYEALGAPVPVFAHVPVVNEPNSKKKLSKRDMKKFVTPDVRAKLHAVGWTDAEIDSRDDLNPATVAFYRELGYLPAALVNYLGRLGWSLDDKTEVMPLETMIGNFGLERVNNSPASFDPEKLAWMAGEYMKQLPLEQRVDGVLPFLVRAKLVSEPVSPAAREHITKLVERCGERIAVFSDILKFKGLLAALPGGPQAVVEVRDEALLSKHVRKEGVPELLRQWVQEVGGGPFDAAQLQTKTEAICVARGLKPGALNHALRVAATGEMVGIGIYDTLELLGRDLTLRRIEKALA